jgi:hypothetical protein
MENRMNERQRFGATMHYQARDRSPICDFGFWDETLVTWQQQGLPLAITASNSDDYFGMDAGIDRMASSTGMNVDLLPEFEQRVLEDHGDHEIFQQKDGVRVQRKKFMGSIPHPISHRLVDRESWKKHFLPRLDPTDARRLPADLSTRVAQWKNSDRPEVLVLSGGSLYGKLRNWMGLEALSYTVHDDPAWFEEMVETLANVIIGTLTPLLETGVAFDACGMWEDMAYNAGPLLSPRHFRRFLMPHYRRITDLLHNHSVDVIWLDCDGNIDALLPLWLEVGVNCMFPVEIGTWGADPIRYRRIYGKALLMMGGFDKHILAGPREGIRAEVERLTQLVEEGGYIPFCDHRVPPDVPYDNYLYYLKTIRQVWGKGINLKKTGWDDRV